MRYYTLLLLFIFISCNKDDDSTEDEPDYLYEYSFNEGQALEQAAYQGDHNRNMTAQLKLRPVDTGGTLLEVTLTHTVEGETYPVHAHDAAENTNHGNPYNLSVNSEVMDQNPVGNGGTVTISHYSPLSRDSISKNYNGYFVVHDPLQDMNTADPTTFLILGKFAR